MQVLQDAVFSNMYTALANDPSSFTEMLFVMVFLSISRGYVGRISLESLQ